MRALCALKDEDVWEGKESRNKRRRKKDEVIIVHIHVLIGWSSGRYDMYLISYTIQMYLEMILNKGIQMS